MRADTEICYEEIIFRPHPLGYLLALAGLLGAGVASLTLAARHHAGWLAGAALVVALGVTLVARYTAGRVIIRGCDLILRTGTWTTREVSLPLWEVHPTVVQSLPGRLLDYGVVILAVDGERYTAQVGQLRALLRLIAIHRMRLLGLAERQLLRTTLPQAARVLEDRWR